MAKAAWTYEEVGMTFPEDETFFAVHRGNVAAAGSIICVCTSQNAACMVAAALNAMKPLGVLELD